MMVSWPCPSTRNRTLANNILRSLRAGHYLSRRCHVPALNVNPIAYFNAKGRMKLCSGLENKKPAVAKCDGGPGWFRYRGVRPGTCFVDLFLFGLGRSLAFRGRLGGSLALGRLGLEQ